MSLQKSPNENELQALSTLNPSCGSNYIPSPLRAYIVGSGAPCMPHNRSPRFTKMKGTADWIRILAFANIIIASVGLCGDIAGAALDWSRDPAIKVGPTGLCSGSGFWGYGGLSV